MRLRIALEVSDGSTVVASTAAMQYSSVIPKPTTGVAWWSSPEEDLHRAAVGSVSGCKVSHIDLNTHPCPCDVK